jgi:hypothetical protein
MDGRLWAELHEAFSADLGRRLDRVAAKLKTRRTDPLPAVGRAMALVLAVSVTSLSLGATLA